MKECFKKYYNKQYNGFGTPKTNVYSTCLQYKKNIKKTKDPTTIPFLVTNNKFHKFQAMVIYNFLKENSKFASEFIKNLHIPRSASLFLDATKFLQL